jgi:hypothetical protein
MSHGNSRKQGQRPSRRRNTLRRWHRRLGIVSALVVVLLVVTGWTLNHTDALGLAARDISAGWLIDWYGIGEPASIDVYGAQDRRAAWIDGNLYLEDRLLGVSIEQPAGVFVEDGLVYLFAGTMLTIFGPGEDQYEQVYLDATVRRVSKDERSNVIVSTNRGLLDMNMESLEMTPHQGAVVAWLQPQPLGEADKARWANVYKSSFISVERFVLDLHSGRILGGAGAWIMDIFALIFLILAVTGIISWISCRDQVNGDRQSRRY